MPTRRQTGDGTRLMQADCWVTGHVEAASKPRRVGETTHRVSLSHRVSLRLPSFPPLSLKTSKGLGRAGRPSGHLSGCWLSRVQAPGGARVSSGLPPHRSVR